MEEVVISNIHTVNKGVKMSKYYDIVEINKLANNLIHGTEIMDSVVKGIRKYGMDKKKVYEYVGPYPQSWNIEFNNIWSMFMALNKEDYNRLMKCK